MTENEAIKELSIAFLGEFDRQREAKNLAIKALEEIQRWHTSDVNPNIKNVFANMSTQICHNCDHKDEYIEELEAEIEKYRAIGTVEECQAAVERQKAKKAALVTRGNGFIKFYPCPHCSTPQKYIPVYPNQNYCVNCGQKLDWRGEE